MFEQCQGEFYQMNKCCSFRDGKCGEKTHKPLCERKKITDLLEMQRKRESHFALAGSCLEGSLRLLFAAGGVGFEPRRFYILSITMISP